MIEILQVRGEAYSSWSEKNVNDSRHTSQALQEFDGWKNVDTKADGREAALGAELAAIALVEKLRMKVDNAGKNGRGRE